MSEWAEAPAAFSLADHEVHIWLAHLPSVRTSFTILCGVLSDEECARARKFHFAEHRERWQMTRGILRLLLASYLETPASEIAFQYGAHGKPELKRSISSGLRFNTSHSGDYAAFAFTRAGQVGVDIECIRDDMPGRDDIVRRYFAPGEQREWFAVPESERARAFFKLWTRKEAFVKARGSGLFSGLDRFEVSLDAPRVVCESENASGAEWWMAELPALPGHEGAVTVQASHCAVRFWKWSGDKAAS
jgi:4'-phosphopantetheinyl transferase